MNLIPTFAELLRIVSNKRRRVSLRDLLLLDQDLKVPGSRIGCLGKRGGAMQPNVGTHSKISACCRRESSPSLALSL